MPELLSKSSSKELENFNHLDINDFLTTIWETDLDYETFRALELELPINIISIQLIDDYCRVESLRIEDRNLLYEKVNSLKIQDALASLPDWNRTMQNLVKITGLNQATIRKYCQENSISLANTLKAKKIANDLKIEQALEALPENQRTRNNLARATGLGLTRITKYCQEKGIRLRRTAKVEKTDGSAVSPAEADRLEMKRFPARFQVSILNARALKPDFKLDLSLVSIELLETIETLLIDNSPFEIKLYLEETYRLSIHEIYQYLLILGLDLSNQRSLIEFHNNQIIARAIAAIPASERTLDKMAQNLVGFSQARIKVYCSAHGIKIIDSSTYNQNKQLESDKLVYQALLEFPRSDLNLENLSLVTKKSVEEIREFLERYDLSLFDLRHSKTALQSISITI